MKTLLGILLWASVVYGDVLPSGRAAVINGEVATIFARLEAAQTAWAIAHPGGRFVQILPVGTTDGAASRSVDYTRGRPSDRSSTWADLDPAIAGMTLVAVYVVDEYLGPRGMGYLLSANITLAGTTWRRTRHVGPEVLVADDSDAGWYAIAP